VTWILTQFFPLRRGWSRAARTIITGLNNGLAAALKFITQSITNAIDWVISNSRRPPVAKPCRQMVITGLNNGLAAALASRYDVDCWY